MAINLHKTRTVTLFEIDRLDPHDLARFHRTISGQIALGTISADDFEEVVGMYQGAVNVAYCMSTKAWRRVLPLISRFMRHQLEVYEYDLDALMLWSLSQEEDGTWRSVLTEWCSGHAFGTLPSEGAIGWTFFPSSGLYFELIAAPGDDQ